MSPSTTLVLFDIDGTLIRGAGLHHKQALIDGIRSVTGISTNLDGLATSGMLDRDLITTMLKAANTSYCVQSEVIGRILQECQNSYEANCPEDLTAFLCPGVNVFLEELRGRGAVLGLVTGNLSRIARRKTERAGIGKYFFVGAFAEDAGTRTELARIAAERAKERDLLAPGAHISLIGDHPNDVIAAKANRFQSIAVATGLISMEELKAAEPEILAASLEELRIEDLFPVAFQP